MALRSGIVRPSAELKSTYTSRNQFKGIVCEKAVVRLLSQKGWRLEFQRARTEISEIDLILTRNENLVLIEVKKLDQDWQAFERIGKKQFQFMQLNINLWTNRFPQLNVSGYVAWVNRLNQVSFLKIE